MAFYKGLKPRMPFADFVEWLCGTEGHDGIADRHWLSQHCFLYNNDKPICNYVGRFENLENELTIISEKLNLPAIELEQKGWISADWNNKKGGYRSYYNDRTRDLIAKRYARDIELFGYEF